MKRLKTFFHTPAILLLSAIIPLLASGAYAADASGVTLPAKVSPGVAAELAQAGEVDVLLSFDDTDAKALAKQMRKDRRVKNDDAAIIAEKGRLYKQKKEKVLSRLVPGDYRVNKDYNNFPVMFMRVNNRALQQLLGMGEVTSVSENTAVRPYLTQSLPLIGATPSQAWAYSTGAGTSVAVLDTGVDYTQSAFGGCTAPNDPTTCRVSFEQCFATGGCDYDYSGCTSPPYPYNCHGTNVSGVVVGVAPDTKVLSLDIFRTNGLAYYNDILDALDWVLTNKDVYNIVAANMSLGGGRHTDQCPSDLVALAISNLKSAGITTAVASGNDGYTDATGAPACGPDAVSVGAVYDSNVGGLSYPGVPCTDYTTAADKVACFSNSASFLTMLAPGAIITAAGISMTGTSQATPHVAGAVALLKSLDNTLSVDEVISKLAGSGVPVLDSRNNITKPRIDLAAAINTIDPIISVSPASLSFMAAAGGLDPAGQSLDIMNTGGGTLNWSFAVDPAQTWATGTPPGGIDAGTITVHVDTSGMLSPGTYTANPQITAAGALNDPVTVPVTLTLIDPAYSEDFETSDLSRFPWVTGGDGIWTVQNSTMHTGGFAAQSPSMAVNKLGYLEVVLNVTAPEYVYFWLKTSTISTYDTLKFRIDGTNEGKWDGWYGETPWTFFQTDRKIDPGIHTFRWEYSTAGSDSTPDDAVWIDDIFFPPSNLQIPAVSFLPASKDFGSVISGGASATQSFTVSNTGAGNLVIGSLGITGANSSDFAKLNDTCSGQTLTPSGTCTVGVQFTPHSVGTKSASLTVPANYPAFSYAALSGTGADAYTLSVTKDPAGTGSGTVTSEPSGITCGADCSEAYAQGTGVVLTATADSGSVFLGWSGGGCSGTGTCSVTVTEATTVTARFDLIPPVAAFDGLPLSGQAPLYVGFSDSSTNNPSSWSWTFGDGGVSSEQNPSHNFKTAGNYTVSLTAANPGGPDTVTKVAYITVSPCPSDPVKIIDTEYPTLQSAYTAAVDGNEIELQALDLPGDVTCSKPVPASVVLKGGYGCSYGANPAETTIIGHLTISSPVTVEHIVIQQP